MKKAFGKEMDLTSGNLFWKIPLFALPMALTTWLQLLYTTIDLWTVANFGGGSSSMSAVGSNGALIHMIITVFLAMSLGANVAIANAKGSGNKVYAEKVLHTALVLALFLGIAVGVAGAFLSGPLLKLMGTIDSIIDKATTYLTIYFVGLPFLMIYNYCAQIMRALGDSNKPLIILTISGIINVLFDLLFVVVFKLDVAGVAWATVISEAVSAILSILAFTFNKGGFVSFSPKKLAIDSIALKEIVRIGLPAGLQGLAFSVPNVLIQSSLYTITNDRIPVEDIVNGSAASGQVEGYIYALIEALSGACVAFVGQNYGARKKENIRKVFWYAQIWSIIANLLASLVCFVLANPLLGLFIHEADQEHLSFAIEAGKQRLFLFLCTYWLDGIMDIDSSYVRGMKRSTAPAIIIFFGCTVSRIIFLFTLFKLEPFHNVTWLYAAFPISWVLVDLVYIPVVITIQKKAFREIGTPSSLLNGESL